MNWEGRRIDISQHFFNIKQPNYTKCGHFIKKRKEDTRKHHIGSVKHGFEDHKYNN